MAYSRRLGVIGILSVCWLAAVGCDDDGDRLDVSTDGGEAGEAPGGGESSRAGSANNAGKGGAGTAGASGVSNGGDGGTAVNGVAGAGGDAGGAASGAGGAAAGASGAGGSAAGSDAAGAGGDGGAAGAGGVPVAVAKSCGNECEGNADCDIPNVTGQKCDQTSHRCYDSTAATCETHEDCIPAASFWDGNCASDAACAPGGGESCVALGGLGYCAIVPGEGGCTFGEPATLPRFGAAGEAIVCVSTYGLCQSGACSFSCAEPLLGGCLAGNGDTCNPTTGLCECQQASECESGVCGADSQCAQCATAADCPGGITGQDSCVNGKCGCSAASVCPDLTESATPVCE